MSTFIEQFLGDQRKELDALRDAVGAKLELSAIIVCAIDAETADGSLHEALEEAIEEAT